MRELEKTLKALANKRRLTILKYLKIKNRATVGDIADEIDLSFKATSKHLGILSALDILEKNQQSLNMFYSLAQNQKPPAKFIIALL